MDVGNKKKDLRVKYYLNGLFLLIGFTQLNNHILRHALKKAQFFFSDILLSSFDGAVLFLCFFLFICISFFIELLFFSFNNYNLIL